MEMLLVFCDDVMEVLPLLERRRGIQGLHFCAVQAMSIVRREPFVVELMGVNQGEAWTEIGMRVSIRIVVAECV